MIRQAFLIALLLVVGAAVLAPIFVFIAPDPLPGDFTIALAGRQYPVSVAYSLCASAGLGLFYWIMKR